MEFEEYRKKMNHLAEMQAEFDDPALQKIREKMEEQYPELFDQYCDWLWKELEKENKQ